MSAVWLGNIACLRMQEARPDLRCGHPPASWLPLLYARPLQADTPSFSTGLPVVSSQYSQPETSGYEMAVCSPR